MSAQRIGILGGTFDPIHRGHLDVADAAARALSLTSLFVIPSNIPPHRPQPFASAYHRFAMVALAVADRPGWRAVDLELRATTPSYTASTLEQMRNRGYLPRELFFVIGADAFRDIATWHDYPAILETAHFAVVSRPGYPASELREQLPDLARRMISASSGTMPLADPLIILIDAPTADVSSTAIRRTLGEGRSIDQMVSKGVQQHIEQHGLYVPGTPGRRLSDGQYRHAASELHGEE